MNAKHTHFFLDEGSQMAVCKCGATETEATQPKPQHTPNGKVKWTRREIPDFVWNAIKDKSGLQIVRAVNSHEALLAVAKDSLAIIKRLADKNGMFFDDRDNQMGLEGKLIQAIAQAEGKEN